MRILFLAENYKQWVASTIYDEQKAIKKKLTDSVFYGPGFRYKNSCVNEIINEIFGLNKPDAIFCYINEKRLLGKPMPNEISSKYSVPNSLKVFPTGLHKVKVPKIAWINDFWHCTRQEWEKILIGNGFDIAFATYCPPFIREDIFDKFFSKKVQEKVLFVPWPRAVSTDTYADYNLKKIYDITLLGSLDEDFYPLRVKMHNAFSNAENIKYFNRFHPGYRFCDTNDLVGSKYAECINQSHLFASCTGIYNIPFIKLYEAMASGSLLLCDRPQGAEYLGLKNQTNYVSVNENNFIDIAVEYLKNHEKCKKIASNGCNLIREKHNVEIRAKEFKEVIDSILNENSAKNWAKLSPNWNRSRKKGIVLKAKEKCKCTFGYIMDNEPSLQSQCKDGTVNSNTNHIKDLNVSYSGHSGPYKKKETTKKMIISNDSKKIKRKILFIVDAPNWAHDYKTINLQSQLSGQYDIEKCFCDNVQVENIENADIVVIYYWGQLLNGNMQKLLSTLKRNKHKVVLGICSHHEMNGSNRNFGLNVINEYASATFVNNRLLLDEFSPYFEIPVFYTPNGVDTTFFKPNMRKNISVSLRVGWAGSLKNHGDKRGYYDYILPAVESVDGVELVTASREEFWRNQQQMREFYDNIDVYICASRTEGTPNPCLEAAACGLPLLTTYVGNMPELIENGVNGLFIKRDINDVVQKIKLMRDNHRLLLQLSEKARERSLKWDWQIKAKNYKHMFEAILADNDQKKSLFHSSDQVYLASADKMDMVLKNCQQFIKVPNRNIDSYVSVIGGMSGLNYLCLMAPKEITFFDTNFCAVEYVKCMIEIICNSNGCRDFISRVFCRSIDMFLKENNYEDLTVYNQNEYLEMNIDKMIYRELMSLLTPFSIKIYKEYIEPLLYNKILSGVRNCRQLVPCYPVNERVPVGGGEENGWNEHGKFVPNLNTFFYGNGWLSSDDAFNYIKEILKTKKIKYKAFDLFRDELDSLADFSGNVVIHCSNIDDWYPEKWSEWKQKVIEKSISKRGDLSVITTNGGVKHSLLDPHTKAFECIKPYVYGKIVEVTHKVPWGFHEFKKDTIIFHEYINGNNPISDTTIIHNLVGEGINHNIFEKVYRIALKKSNRVIILEHNQESLDWKKNANNSSYMTISQLNDILKKIAIPNKVIIHPVIKSPGYYDLSRNIIFVVDTFNSFNTKKYENTVKEIKSEKKFIGGNICHYSESPFSLKRNDNIKMLDKETLKKKNDEKESDKKKNTFLTCQSSDPYVSVIVPTFNRPTKLAEALKSIINQTFKNYEIIVVNDSGQDAEPVVTALNQNNIITYVRHCRNKGLAAARNTGIKLARGKYIAYLDDDDIYYPEHLSTLFEHLENNDYKVAYTDAYRSHKSYKNKECVEVKKDLPFSNDFDCDRMLVSNYIPVLCFMHEKSCLEKIGYFDEKLSSHEDWDLWIRMSQKYNFLHIKKITAEFSWLTDGSTMTSGKRDDMLLTFQAVYHKHADLVAEKPHIAKIQRENTKILENQIKNKNNKKKCSIIIPVYNKIE